jgi:hypothetical protein
MCQLSVAPTRIAPLEKSAKMVFASIRWFLTTPIQTTPTQKTSRRMPSIPVKHVRSTTTVVDRWTFVPMGNVRRSSLFVDGVDVTTIVRRMQIAHWLVSVVLAKWVFVYRNVWWTTTALLAKCVAQGGVRLLVAPIVIAKMVVLVSGTPV